MIIIESAIFSTEGIKNIEKRRKAKYVCDTEFEGVPVCVFYCDEEHPVSHSRYMAIYYKYPFGSEESPDMYVTDGSPIEDQEIKGIKLEDGTIIFSRSRHDFFRYKDSVAIDGGRAYTRVVGDSPYKIVTLKVKEGKLYEQES